MEIIIERRRVICYLVNLYYNEIIQQNVSKDVSSMSIIFALLNCRMVSTSLIKFISAWIVRLCEFQSTFASHDPPRSCLTKTTISDFSTVPDPSLSKVAKTSSKASSENSSPDPRLPRVSWTNFLVSCLSRAPLLSTSYVSQIWSMTPWMAYSSADILL